jgi:predicted GNAT family N-acyltransferase
VTEVREARGDEERRAVFALRHEVFVEEQGVPLDLELDEHDDDALHLIALDGGRILGTCRLAGAKFGRLVVARDARGRGIGSALLEQCEQHARAQGHSRMTLDAQTSAVGLYERAGYTKVGDVFLDAGIEHVTMEKALA